MIQSSPVRHVWSHGEATMHPVAAAVEPVTFVLPSGKRVSPFHRAAWIDEGRVLEPPMMNILRGDWSCLPFGIPYPDASVFTPEWREAVTAGQTPGADVLGSTFEVPHGFGSNNTWTLIESPEGITATLAYPEESGIATVERRLRPVTGQAAVDIGFTATARRPVRTNYGFHPTFALPKDEGQAILSVDGFEYGLVHPTDFEPGAAQGKPGARFTSLEAVPLAAGGTRNFTRFPLAGDSEELLLLVGVSGVAELSLPGQGVRYRLSWDPAKLPQLILWVSNRGRKYAPWDGRNVCLGIEPVCSAFELGGAISVADNPISRGGHATSITVTPEVPWSAGFRLEAFDL